MFSRSLSGLISHLNFMTNFKRENSPRKFPPLPADAGVGAAIYFCPFRSSTFAFTTREASSAK